MAGLSPRVEAMVRAELAQRGTQAAVARRIGINGSTLSMLLAGKYPADVAKVERRIEHALGNVDCPYLRRPLSVADCQGQRDRRLPTSNPHAIAHWTACQTCSIGAGLAAGKE
ncbi:MAG: LacI family transcriptional regulator [Rhizobiales bacterium]|nr:LacI family transcriptional regulator [Hyphomicrobiales bacterium]